MSKDYTTLVDQACAVRARSYSPYSRFKVGAALLGRSGRVYLGTNVENASFGLSICAERAAVFRAVAEGEQDFDAIAVCADGTAPTPPCGACRQVLLEFGPDMVLLTAGELGSGGEVRRFTVGQLVPEAFRDFRPGGGEDGR
ncbi:MAG: cytidine deaminase [bacterium]